MKTLLIIFLACAGCAWSARADEDEAKADAKSDAKSDAKAEAVQVKHDANGQTILTLDAAAQQRIGLTLTNPASMAWTPEIRAFGRVLDTTPLMEALAELRRAEIAHASSWRELERAKKLKQDDNISERALQDLETTDRQNTAALEIIRARIAAAWGTRVAAMTKKSAAATATDESSKLGLTLEELVAPGAGRLVRVDLPVGQRIRSPVFVGGQKPFARLEPLANPVPQIGVIFVDLLPVMDAATQQQGLLFLYNPDLYDGAGQPDRLIPGEAVTAYVQSNEPPISGVAVPADAVVRHENKGWIFVQTGAAEFARRELPLDRPVAGGFFTATLSATNRVVVTGAQTLLSAELSGDNFNSGQRD